MRSYTDNILNENFLPSVISWFSPQFPSIYTGSLKKPHPLQTRNPSKNTHWEQPQFLSPFGICVEDKLHAVLKFSFSRLGVPVYSVCTYVWVRACGCVGCGHIVFMRAHFYTEEMMEPIFLKAERDGVKYTCSNFKYLFLLKRAISNGEERRQSFELNVF